MKGFQNINPCYQYQRLSVFSNDNWTLITFAGTVEYNYAYCCMGHWISFSKFGEKRIHFDAFYWDNWIINSPVIQSLSRLLAIPSNETILHLTLKIGTQKILKSENWQRTCFTWVHTEYSTVWLSFFILQQYSDFLCKKTLNKLYRFVSIKSSKPWSLSGHLINQSYLNCKFFSPRTNLFSWHQKQYLSPMFSVHDISKRSSYKLRDNPTSYEITYFITKTFAKFD